MSVHSNIPSHISCHQKVVRHLAPGIQKLAKLAGVRITGITYTLGMPMTLTTAQAEQFTSGRTSVMPEQLWFPGPISPPCQFSVCTRQEATKESHS